MPAGRWIEKGVTRPRFVVTARHLGTRFESDEEEDWVMLKVLDHIFTWAWFSEPHGYDFNGHQIRHAEGTCASNRSSPATKTSTKSPGSASVAFS